LEEQTASREAPTPFLQTRPSAKERARRTCSAGGWFGARANLQRALHKS